ncbi:hypothetical protein [Streptomyces chartreusis]
MGAEDDSSRDTYSVTSAHFGTVYTGDTEIRTAGDRKLAFISTVAAAGSVLGVISLMARSNDPANEFASARTTAWLLLSIVVLLAGLVVFFVIPWFRTRRTYMKNQNESFTLRIKAERERHRQAMEQLKKTTELATLMELNQDQIATYHRIVTQQADKSFKSSRTAMGVGLFLLVAAAVGGAYVPIEEIRWFIGALAAFSTVLTGYLTRTYLAMYKESIGQLNRYFDQPVLNSYYLTAERLTVGLDSVHAHEVRCQIINEVLATSSRMGSRPAPPKDPKPKAAKPKPKKPRKQAASVNGTPQA